jgi:hypothetical protein
MSYSSFSLADLRHLFQVQVNEVPHLYSHIAPVAVGAWLKQFLEKNVSLATSINTEKARSEFIIAPVLAELRQLKQEQVGIFSGITFDVEPEAGLAGVCDFLIGRGPAQLFLTAPLVAVVEAKNEDIRSGIPQCIAEMIGVHKFNANKGSPIEMVYGTVTIGDNWRFLQMQFPRVSIDTSEYLISDVEKIMGILMHMVR